MSETQSGAWQCGICDTKHPAWVRYCGCVHTDKNDKGVMRCAHDRVLVKLEDTEYKAKGQLLGRIDTWHAECQDCNQSFDVVWTGRTEDNRLDGLEIIQTFSAEEAEEDEVRRVP